MASEERAGSVEEASRVQATAETGPSSRGPALSSSKPSLSAEGADAYEQTYVHAVYDTIAPHFSASRFKAWPRVQSFLQSLPPYTMVADVGCGNGKYFASAQRRSPPTDAVAPTDDAEPPAELSVPAHRYVLGMDASIPLLCLTQRAMADPNVEGSAGTQREPSARGRREWEVPMPRTDVLRSDARGCPLRPGLFDAAVSIAVIHHFATPARRREGVQALLRLVRPVGGLVLIYVWAREQRAKRPRVQQQASADAGDALVSWEMNQRFDAGRRTFQRYYHFFQAGELEQLCAEAADELRVPVHVKESFFDSENWCVVLERTGAAPPCDSQ